MLGIGLHGLLLALSPTQVLACVLVGHLVSSAALSCICIQPLYQTLQTNAVCKDGTWGLFTNAKMTSIALGSRGHKALDIMASACCSQSSLYLPPSVATGCAMTHLQAQQRTATITVTTCESCECRARCKLIRIHTLGCLLSCTYCRSSIGRFLKDCHATPAESLSKTTGVLQWPWGLHIRTSTRTANTVVLSRVCSDHVCPAGPVAIPVVPAMLILQC